MYLESREELDLLAREYARRPALRRGIRLHLRANTADILLIVYCGMGRKRTRAVINRILNLDGGHLILAQARNELSEFHYFGAREVEFACENVIYLIAAALEQNWDAALERNRI